MLEVFDDQHARTEPLDLMGELVKEHEVEDKT